LTQLYALQNKDLDVLNRLLTKPSGTTVIQTELPTGNLKERTLLLSQQIIELLQNDSGCVDRYLHYLHGQDDPATRQRITLDCVTRTGTYFRYQIEPQVIEIRNELATLGFKSKELNDILDRDQQNIALSKQVPDFHSTLNFVDIQSVAKSLSDLASQLQTKK